MTEPWSEEQARWIVRRAATLAAAGAEPVGPFVLPDSRFFPDRFDKSPASIGKLFERMKIHVGLTDTPTEVVLVDADEGTVVSSCSSGGCGGSAMKTLSGERVSTRDGKHTIVVATSEVGHPSVITTVLARAIGQVFLGEADLGRHFAKTERAPAGDLAAALLGLGALIANGAGIEVKGCGGIKVHSATSLGAPEAVLALALACEREALRGRAVEGLERGLDSVARAIFPLATAFMHENRSVVRRLDDAPESVEKGEFTLRPAGSSIGGRIRRLFGIGKPKTELDPLEELELEIVSSRRSPGAASSATNGSATNGQPKTERSAASKQRLEEIRALVDESFE